MSGKATVYISSVTSNKEIRKQQVRIQDVLTSLKIEFEVLDVSMDGNLQKMRDICKDPGLLAPQLCNGSTYCGNYEDFEYAVENKDVRTFLKLA